MTLSSLPPAISTPRLSFDSFYDQLSEGVQVFESTPPYKLVYANAACGQRLGLDRQKIGVLTLADFIEKKPTQAWIKRLLAHSKVIEVPICYGEKAAMMGRGRLSALENGTAERYIRLVLNQAHGGDDKKGSIQANKWVDKEQSYAYMRAVTESSSHYVWFLDSELRLTFFNSHFAQAMSETMGREPKKGDHMLELLAGSEKTHHIALWKKRCQRVFQGQVANFSIRIKHHVNHNTIWYHVFLRPMYALHGDIKEISVVAYNITAQKKAEEALRQSEEKFRTIFERFQDIYVCFDKRGMVRLVSPSVEEMTGYPMAALVGHSLDKWVSLPHSAARICQEVEREDRLMNVEGVLQTKQGNKMYCIGHLSLNRTDKHAPIVEAVFRDISQLKKTSQELEKAKAMAEQLLRMKQNFLANISHEIRTPINGMLGMLSLLERTQLSKEQQEYVQLSKKSSETLLHLLNDILYLSKIEAGKLSLQPQCVCMRDLFGKLPSLFLSEMRMRKDAFSWSVSEEVPRYLYLDETRLLQVISNLLSNAFKFSPVNEPVLLTMSVLKRKGDHYTFRIDVRDKGIGISSGDQARLFQSFSQVEDGMRKKYSGTGLGLYISKLLVKQMGGEIGVSSTPDEGSTFYFTFESRKMRGPSKGVPKVAEIDLGDLSPHLLIVDDNEINRKVSGELLRRAGCRVWEADSGHTAIELALKHPFDLILMDIQMPEKDGIETTQQIRTRLPDAPPVIAMTAYSMEEDRARFLAQGMDDYIAKPIEADVLMAMIRRWMNKKTPIAQTKNGHPNGRAAKTAAPPHSTIALRTRAEWELNETQLEQLIHYGGIGIVKESLAELKQDLQALYRSCCRAARARDLAEVFACAHTLKGSASMLGLKGVVKAAEQIQTAVKKEDWKDITNKLGILQKKIRKFNQCYFALQQKLLAYEKNITGRR